MTGTIKSIPPGKQFGFIVRDGQSPEQRDLFFHESATGGEFQNLKEGDKVSFEEVTKGDKVNAENVVKI